MGDGRKVLLLDGHSLGVPRVFALPDTMSTTSGSPQRGLPVSFTSMLLKVLDEERPDGVVVAFDGPRADLHRTKEFPEYKAHRPPMPEGLRSQMDMIENLLEHMNIPRYVAAGTRRTTFWGRWRRRSPPRGAGPLS